MCSLRLLRRRRTAASRIMTWFTILYFSASPGQSRFWERSVVFLNKGTHHLVSWPVGVAESCMLVTPFLALEAAVNAPTHRLWPDESATLEPVFCLFVQSTIQHSGSQGTADGWEICESIDKWSMGAGVQCLGPWGQGFPGFHASTPLGAT